MLSILLFPLGLLVTRTIALKTWKPSTNTDDPKNWQSGILPYGCVRLDFSAAEDMSIQFSPLKDTSIASLKLPRTGSINLPEYKIYFMGKQNCSNIQDGVFSRDQIKGWLDPDNWGYQSKDWIPHGDRIPCTGEEVVFPVGKSYTISLPTIILSPKKITYHNQSYGAEEWSTFLISEDGYEIFRGTPETRLTVWNTDSGCYGNSKVCDLCARQAFAIRDWEIVSVTPSAMLDAVCLYAKPRCETIESVSCHNPVLPENHCCPICGALIDIIDESRDGLPLTTFQETINKNLLKDTSIKFHISRKFDGNIQIVLTGDVYENIFMQAKRLTNVLEGSSKLSLKYSGLDKRYNLVGYVAGLIFGTLLLVISTLITFSCIYIYFPNPKFKWRPIQRQQFIFARFENRINEENIEVLTDDEVSNRICNPLYNPGRLNKLLKIFT